MEIGKQLHIVRITKNLSQKEVTASINTNHSNLSNIEKGKTDPKFSTILKLLDYYGYEFIIQEKKL